MKRTIFKSREVTKAEVLNYITNRDSLKSGYDSFDKFTSGFHDGEIYVLGGRPGVGKSMFALNIVHSIAVKQKQPVLYISLDQPKEYVLGRLLHIEGGKDYMKLIMDHYSEEDVEGLKKSFDAVCESNIRVEFAPELRIESLRKELKKGGSSPKYKFIVVDYLQLLRSRKRTDNRHEEISEIMKVLKDIARESHLAVLVLSQLNRSSEYRADHKPILSDLRDSGSIEEYANQVYLLYNDDYYYSQFVDDWIVGLQIAKNKLGPKGEIDFAFCARNGRFIELEEEKDT